MLALLQRVTFANIAIDQQIIGAIAQGILVFLAFEPNDTTKQADRLIDRILNYRIFVDHNDRMNLSVKNINGGILLIPQFTLAANTDKGMRPSFTSAATPQLGKELFDYFVTKMQQSYQKIACGKFGANMQITLCNDGPVTFILKVKSGNC
jgi:D-aminoacyl-tRNA deacylase